MKTKFMKGIAVLLTMCMFLGIPVPVKAAKEVIKPSNVFYDVTIRDKAMIFISNKKAVEWKVGDSYFMTYTVKKVQKDETTQSGMIATTDREAEYPYLKGAMYLDQKSVLLDEGYTYFLRFDVTEDGYTYTAGKAKGDSSSYVDLPYPTGDMKVKAPYFGIWLGEGQGASVELSKVQCYDKDGNDLGIYAPKSTNISISEMVARTDVNHTYSFSTKNTARVAFGNSKKTKSDAIFLEYTIKNVEAKDVDQSGATMSNAPTDPYPHQSVGCLNYSSHKSTNECQLITEGAKYLVRFERGEKNFEVLVKRTTAKGTVDYFTFPYYAGEYNPVYSYVNMWIGNICSLTADFVEVKCYDNKGNNLGIQTNMGVSVTHQGELEDYSQCEAVYYCAENNTFIALEDEKTASKRLDGEESVVVGSYTIANSVLTLRIGKETEKFNYLYEFFTDDAGQKYQRLREVEVTYMSDKYDGSVIETVRVSAENGFKASKPTDPIKKGYTFNGWTEGNGKIYDFNTVVTEAKTLYASWEGETERAATGFFAKLDMSGNDVLVVVTVCTFLVMGTTVGIIMLKKGRKKK